MKEQQFIINKNARWSQRYTQGDLKDPTPLKSQGPPRSNTSNQKNDLVRIKNKTFHGLQNPPKFAIFIGGKTLLLRLIRNSSLLARNKSKRGIIIIIRSFTFLFLCLCIHSSLVYCLPQLLRHPPTSPLRLLSSALFYPCANFPLEDAREFLCPLVW